jgi:hypothetical protein
MGTHDVLTSSENPNWRTPKWLAQALDEEFGFVLDAAADRFSRIVPDLHFLGPGSDLLDNALCGVGWWDAVASVYLGGVPMHRRAIFVNPPYSRKRYSETRDPAMLIESWVKQAAVEGQHGVVVALLPYSPQTEWWRTYVEGHAGSEDGQPYAHLKAVEVRKFPFRLAFEPPPDYAPKGHGKASGANINNAVVIWRPNSYVEPWTPVARYWLPKHHATRARSVRAASHDQDEHP